ncbi:MAG: 6-phosphofructokinase [Clostridia bacterium]|nr:6-phosphofructokinase [Clostridia bacterium]MBQ2421256.1 6-phosphofructokinase [Clostridia bacterium]MBQ5598079.1 6-phosphofructokinase [Clostridia bacterium]
MAVKTIGVLTSGGDAPGMNAAIRAVVRTAIAEGLEVKGIMRGYAGLIDEEIVDLNLRSVSDIIHRGGTMLYTARCPEFKEEAGLQKAIANCRKHGIDGIVVIGGDGSYRGARDLSERGLPCVGIPGTIDNDISSTEYTIGFDTAMNTAMEMVDRLRDTAQSHERCTIVEVMGRRAGYIALHTGIAVGATAVLVPEVPFDIEKDVIRKIENAKTSDKKHFIIVVAEGVGHVDELAKEIEAKCGIESRATVLGHVQRGGSPTVRDRVIASKMGHEAVQLLKKGIGNRVVCLNKGDIVDKDIFEALNEKKSYEFDLHKVAHDISI